MLRNGCRVAAAASTKGGAEAAAEPTSSDRLFHGRKSKEIFLSLGRCCGKDLMKQGQIRLRLCLPFKSNLSEDPITGAFKEFANFYSGALTIKLQTL